jgi:hypothetical protein
MDSEVELSERSSRFGGRRGCLKLLAVCDCKAAA